MRTTKLLDYQSLGCSVSLKIDFLFAFWFFPKDLGVVSDEEGERVHQNVRTVEIGYQERWNTAT